VLASQSLCLPLMLLKHRILSHHHHGRCSFVRCVESELKMEI
jgi:hypothetical protein